MSSYDHSDGEDLPPSRSDYWNHRLTHQLRVLLYAEPLLRLLRRDEHRALELQHYSSLSLALKLLDLIIENAGLEHEIDTITAVNELMPLLNAMDVSAGIELDSERHRQMTKRVLGALLNDEDGRRPFQIPYTDFEQGKAIERILPARLLEERHHIDDRIVLHLTNEAANLLLNSLTYDIEDAQAAAEAIVQSQLARGRFNEAINSARMARLHSQGLREKIERILTNTRRDLSRVDWKNEVPRVLTESLEHIKIRCVVEESILETAWERQDVLLPGSNESRQLALIISLIEDCRQRHTELQKQLIGARLVFFDEQERQSFLLRARASFPHFLADILEPLLKTKRVEAEKTLTVIFPFCLGIYTPNAFSLTAYLSRQLQPRREPRPETVPVIQREHIEESDEHLRYSTETYKRAEVYFNALEEPTRLADLLQQAINAHESKQTLEVIVLSALRHFDPQDVGRALLRVDKTDEAQFSIGGFSGNNVLLSNKEVHNE